MDPADLPPTYNEATTSPLPPPTPDPLNSPSRIQPLPSPLTTHLRTLPSRLRATQHALLTAQASTDLDLTYALVPHVEAFLADLTSMARTPPVAELTLVPEAAVPGGDGIKGWGMSGERERGREGEVVRVGRVVVEGQGEGGEKEKGKRAGDIKGEKGGASASASSSSLRPAREAGFDEWGRFETEDRNGGEDEKGWWWFKDEDMARRLAGYLRPEPNLERKRVQAVVVEKKAEKSSRGWFGLGGGRKKSVGEQQASPVSPALSSPGLPSPGAGAVEVDDSVRMTVRAEEVTFRRENEFGVWESRTGFGIVVTVRVRT